MNRTGKRIAALCAVALAVLLVSILLMKQSRNMPSAVSTESSQPAATATASPKPSAKPSATPKATETQSPSATPTKTKVADEPKQTATPKVEATTVPKATASPTEAPVAAEPVVTAQPADAPTEPPQTAEEPAAQGSANGWQPESVEHYHGNGSDAGVCPACGLIYGPSGGADGQYGWDDGLID